MISQKLGLTRYRSSHNRSKRLDIIPECGKTQRWAFRNLKRKALVAQLPHVRKLRSAFNKLFLAIAQVALRLKENKSFLRFIALRTEKIYNSVRIIALRTQKNLVACTLLRCALSEVEILRCALSD